MRQILFCQRIYNGSAGNEDFLSVIEKNYGQLSLGKNQIQKLENKVSKGIHSNIKIYWTKGQFKEDTYYKEISLEKFKENYSEFEKNKLKYLRGILTYHSQEHLLPFYNQEPNG